MNYLDNDVCVFYVVIVARFGLFLDILLLERDAKLSALANMHVVTFIGMIVQVGFEMIPFLSTLFNG